MTARKNPAGADARAADNPVDALRVSITVPEEITIRMIDASAFNDYEIWFFVAGLLASFASGFSVAALSAVAGEDAKLGWLFGLLTVLFAALTCGAVTQMLRKRRSMLGSERSIPFRRSAD